MIKYQLNCKKCQKKFDSWFSSSKEYERLKKKKLLNCISCGSIKVEKSLMSPNFFQKVITLQLKMKKVLEIKNKLKEYKKFVEKNLDYVGDDFAYEARSIHYGGKKRKKVFMEKPQKKKLKIFQKKELKPKYYVARR